MRNLEHFKSATPSRQPFCKTMACVAQLYNFFYNRVQLGDQCSLIRYFTIPRETDKILAHFLQVIALNLTPSETLGSSWGAWDACLSQFERFCMQLLKSCLTLLFVFTPSLRMYKTSIATSLNPTGCSFHLTM